MADPLSLLSKKKKEEESKKPPTPTHTEASALLGSGASPLGRSALNNPLDVGAVLGQPTRPDLRRAATVPTPAPAAAAPPPLGKPAEAPLSRPTTVANPLAASSGGHSHSPDNRFSPDSRDRANSQQDPAKEAREAVGATLAAAGGAFGEAFSQARDMFGSMGAKSGKPMGNPTSPPRQAQPPPTGADVAPGTSFEDILLGEKVLAVVKNCYLMVSNPLCEIRGRLLVTNYRLKFQMPKGTLREELQWMKDGGFFDVPMGIIEDVKEEQTKTATGATELKVKVQTKDWRTLQILLTSEDDVRNIIDAHASFGIPGNPTLLFAFKHAETSWAMKNGSQDTDGWTIFDPLQEYARLGVDTKAAPNPECPWRVSDLNLDYSICQTYPTVLVMPRAMSDHEIRGVAGFRKRGRLPAMSWCAGSDLNFASLWRCAQTTEGLMGKQCHEDEKMVRCIRTGSQLLEQGDRDLLVVDLRPWKSAWANKAGGGGFEGYKNCRLVFGGIDNIHCVRDAWRAMGSAVSSVNDEECGSWLKDVANSSWYDYIGAILGSTLKVIKEIMQKSSVMVHCSDGWDRTAQATSLSMLCLDPHYRTQVGFLRLIQKEWCSFGHKFRTRMGIGEQPTSEYSPVFIQWLECVYQLVSQFPTAFEFSTNVLLRIATEVSTNRYGTFLCDSERERLQKVAPFAISLWSVLLRPEDAATWRNPYFQPQTDTLIPSVSQANYVIWNEYWWRFNTRGAKWRVADAAPWFGVAVPGAAPPPAVAVDAYLAGAPAMPAEEKAHSQSPPRSPGAEGRSRSGGLAALSEDIMAEAKAPRPPPKQVFNDDSDDDPFAKL